MILKIPRSQNCPVGIKEMAEFLNILDISVHFNQHFINACPNLAKAIHNTAGDQCGINNHSPLHNFFPSPMTEECVADFFSCLNNK